MCLASLPGDSSRNAQAERPAHRTDGPAGPRKETHHAILDTRHRAPGGAASDPASQHHAPGQRAWRPAGAGARLEPPGASVPAGPGPTAAGRVVPAARPPRKGGRLMPRGTPPASHTPRVAHQAGPASRLTRSARVTPPRAPGSALPPRRGAVGHPSRSRPARKTRHWPPLGTRWRRWLLTGGIALLVLGAVLLTRAHPGRVPRLLAWDTQKGYTMANRSAELDSSRARL
jgi:hypothetical protein